MAHRPTGCFLAGVTGPGITASGEALLASVSDDPYDVRTFLRVMNPAGVQSHIGTELVSMSEHTLLERGYFCKPGETTRGINEAGLAFTCAMVFENESAQHTGAPTSYTDLSAAMMNSCETVQDAIDLFRSAGAVNPPFSVLLADAAGGLAHVEAGNFGVQVYHRYSHDKPGMVFAVNCYLSSQLVDYNAPRADLENTANNNLARRKRGQQFAEAHRGRLDVPSLARLLSDHANRERDPKENPLLEAWGYSICNHGTRGTDTCPHEQLPWGTVSAEIMQPSARLFWYAYGWPCGQPPEHGDQIYQDKSWGRFVPFDLAGDEGKLREFTAITTTEGAITSCGLACQAAQEAATPVG